MSEPSHSFFSSRSLYQSSLIGIADVECAHPQGGPGSLESEEHPKIIYPRRGAFVYHFSSSRKETADANTAVVLHDTAEFKISHPLDSGDSATTFTLGSGIPESFGTTVHVAPATARAIFETRKASLRQAEPLEIEELAMRAIEPLIAPALNARSAHPVVERAKEAIAVDPFEKKGLIEIAKAVGASPFHLTRAFRLTTGFSLHQYRMQLRIRAGLERIIGGDEIGNVALDCGFSSHSHFTQTFRRTFGVAPSMLLPARVSGSETSARF